MDICNNGSDLGKYFKDITFLSEATKKSNNDHEMTESNERLPESSEKTCVSKQTNSKCKEPKAANLTKPTLAAKTNVSTGSRIRNINFVRNESTKTDKENIDTNESNIPSVISNQCNRLELRTMYIDNSNVKSIAYLPPSDNTKLSNSNTSNREKSSKLSSSNITRELNPSISIIPTQDRCKLASWGLPPNILKRYEAKGITTMFPWQVECLSNYKVIEEGRNLVYSAPTSAGKTLVAEIIMIKTVLERRKKAIFILPFVSVVREKMYYFQDLLSDSGVRVEGFMGGVVPHGGFNATNVAIATIEKANSLINRLMEEKELITLGAVVIDELHLVGDPNRGYLLELLLTKLKFMSLRDDNINVQLIGMSATLPNLSILAKWLDAELYKTDFRPVPLNEQCKIGKNIYDNKLRLIRQLKPMSELIIDSDDILHLCIETISDGHSVLIFCPTKNWCEKLAEQIAFAFSKLGREDTKLGKMLRQQLNPELILETLEQLKRSPTGLDHVLKNTVSFGTAFHHAGLTMDERDIVEGAFRSGSLRVLVATSTLSSGVNLPARRVIIRSPMFGGRLLDSLTYKQMIGRAGRMGKDTAGESILVCKPNEQKGAEKLLSASLQPIESCLDDSGPLIRALLEAIASEVVYTPTDLELYTKCTLISVSNEDESKDLSNEAIKFLVDNEFLLLQITEEERRWVATAFGKACLAASIPPREGLLLLESLQKARRCFVLDTELHVIYLVTPLNSGSQIGTVDWMTFFDLWRMLSESERRVGELVGVEERFFTSAIKGSVRPGKTLNIYKRFFTALALHDLVREVPLSTVCKKYGCCRGVLQSLQQSASTFAGMVTQFCKQLGWDCMELLVSQFQTRLQFGVSRELLDLLRLPMLNGLRARSLYKYGITSVADLAVANELDVERALYKALPFESKEQDGEHESEAAKRNKMRTVFVTGKDGLTPHEAAIMLVQEARVLVQNELGLQDMSWNQNDQSTNKSNTEINSRTQQDIIHSKEESTNMQIENTQSSSRTEINLSENIIQNKCEKTSSIIISQSMNETFLNEEKETSNKSHKNEIYKNNTNVMEIIDSERNIENNVLQSTKNDEKLIDQLLERGNTKCMNSLVEKLSFDFFDESSPKISDNSNRRDSESLIACKGKNRTHNYILKQTINQVDDQNINDVPAKKIRFSNETAVSPRINAITHLSGFGSDIKSATSSPSLFDESLNLDTQVCDILEQNVIDSLRFSDFDDTRFSDNKVTTETETNPKLQTTCTVNNEVQEEKDTKSKNTHKNSLNLTNSRTRHSILSWEDDSWNEPKKLAEKINEIKERKNENVLIRKCIRNANVQHVAETDCVSTSTPEMKKKHNKKFGTPTSTTPDNVRKIPQIHRCKDNLITTSPITRVAVFSKNRTASLDSNKSESEDIVVASQNVEESPLTSIRIRCRLESEKKRRMQTQKEQISDKEKHLNTVSKMIHIEKHKIKPKLKDILAHNIPNDKNYSTDSIVSNSDEDIPMKSMKVVQKSITLKKIQKSPDKVVENVDELSDWKTLNIIKIGNDRGTFNLFKREVMQKQYVALALNCELYCDEVHAIGSKVITSITGERKTRSKKENYVYAEKKLCGAAISWASNIAYYISFTNEQELKVPRREQMKLLKDLLSNTNLHVKCFATKETFRTLYQCCGIAPTCKFLDPKVANWLYDGNMYEKNFCEMVKEYFPQGCFISKKIGVCYYTGPGLHIKSEIPGEFRASAESVLTWHIMNSLLDKLEQLNPQLLYTFKEVEMKTVTSLACMELTGLGVSLKSLQNLSSIIREEITSLEERAYKLAGKKFNFSSSKEVGEVIGLYKGKKISVNKAVLEQSDHPISSLVMSWRKLNGTQSKIVYPILNLAQHSSRIHGNCVTSTLTGRISMHEPNLQNVPRDFSSEDNSFTISVRMAFIPAVGNIMLSADYCQLELRILAHFSEDTTLCDIMRKPGDIFKNIAAKWYHVSEDQVDDKMRQNTKQLCYGMIYGMGVKSLAENLSVDENKAKEFLDSFMNTYPEISKWLNKVREDARTNGYITTILNRRRIFPGLTSAIPSEKAQAERQAVNTKVQGSAADIAKKAMIDVEERIRSEFPNSSIIMPEKNARKLRSNSKGADHRGGYLVLQLHDELLYEVNINDLKQVATIIKESMEGACKLAVPLPVKLKAGPAWGDLTDYVC